MSEKQQPAQEAGKPSLKERWEAMPSWQQIPLALGAALFAFSLWAVVQDTGKRSETAGATGGDIGATLREIGASTSTIRYSVTGSTSQASITIETPTGTSQQSDIDVPISRKSDGANYLEYTFQKGDFVYISAQNSQSSGTVTCKITNADGDVISENTASGAYAIATCDGSAR